MTVRVRGGFLDAQNPERLLGQFPPEVLRHVAHHVGLVEREGAHRRPPQVAQVDPGGVLVRQIGREKFGGGHGDGS